MAKWNKIITSAGAAMLSQAPGNVFQFTRAVCGSGSVLLPELPDQTSISGETRGLSITSSKSAGTSHVLRLQLNNRGMSSTYSLSQIGVFAKIGSGDEILFIILQAEVPEQIPAESESPGYVADYIVGISTSNTEHVTVSLDAGACITVGEKAVPGGVATLGEDGKVPQSQLPPQQQIQDASLTQKGIVQLSDSVTSTATHQAATANAVRLAYERGTAGAAAANNAIPKTEKGVANGVATLDGGTKVPAVQLPDGTTAQKGIVRLNNTVNSTSTALASTASAVKTAYDRGNSAYALANTANNTANNAIPLGSIIMWSGTAGNIPSGWRLCNGTNGTPNLCDRFIVGAGSTYMPGAIGGAASISLNLQQLPAHTHSLSGGEALSNGAHTHTVNAVTTGVKTMYATNSTSNNLGGTSVSTSSAGIHSHTLSGDTQSTGSGSVHENRPPYYALCFIMKV